MAVQNLISLDRAKQNLPVISGSGSDSILTSLIGAASAGIVRYCRRDFSSQTYDELYSGRGARQLFLRQYPVQSVQSVRYRPTTVLRIQNTDQATNQQARVSVTNTGLSLLCVASGVTTTNAVTFVANPTLAGLAAAVNALGLGWQALVAGDSNDYGRWPSADLYATPSYGDGTTCLGALNARGTQAELKLHTCELAGFQVDPRGWLLRTIPYTDPELFHPEDLVWPRGTDQFRVQYTAGFTSIPGDVQEACAQWVAALYWQLQRDPGLKQESVPGVVARTPIAGMPPGVQLLLLSYRNYVLLDSGDA